MVSEFSDSSVLFPVSVYKDLLSLVHRYSLSHRKLLYHAGSHFTKKFFCRPKILLNQFADHFQYSLGCHLKFHSCNRIFCFRIINSTQHFFKIRCHSGHNKIISRMDTSRCKTCRMFILSSAAIIPPTAYQSVITAPSYPHSSRRTWV